MKKLKFPEKKLTKKESADLVKRFKKFGIKHKDGSEIKELKSIVFHSDFEKGMRYAVCHTCGYIQPFQGLWDYPCENCQKKVKIFSDPHEAIEFHRKVKCFFK